MKYISTRSGSKPQNFEQVLLTGLAPDGGLYVPAELPKISKEQMQVWQSLDYSDLALAIVAPFIDGAIPDAELKIIIEDKWKHK